MKRFLVIWIIAVAAIGAMFAGGLGLGMFLLWAGPTWGLITLAGALAAAAAALYTFLTSPTKP